MATEMETTFYAPEYRETVRRGLQAHLLIAKECFTEAEIQREVDACLGLDDPDGGSDG